MTKKNQAKGVINMENLKCIVLEEVLNNGTVYNAVIKNRNGASFQGTQFTSEAFEYLSNHRMFTRGSKYREFYFTLNIEQESENVGLFKKQSETLAPLDLGPLKKEVYSLVEYIEKNLLTLETPNLDTCKSCGFETFDTMMVASKKGWAQTIINNQPFYLKACKKCGTLMLD